MKHVLAFIALGVLCACGAPSQSSSTASTQAAETSVTTNGIEVSNAYASPTPGGVTVSAGYLTISNHAAADDTLLGANSPRANGVDVHTMSMQGGVMQMRPAGSVLIPAGGTLTLAPGSLHLMFTGVTRPFTEGENIPVTLHFDHGGDVEVSLPVHRPPT